MLDSAALREYYRDALQRAEQGLQEQQNYNPFAKNLAKFVQDKQREIVTKNSALETATGQQRSTDEEANAAQEYFERSSAGGAELDTLQEVLPPPAFEYKKAPRMAAAVGAATGVPREQKQVIVQQKYYNSPSPDENKVQTKQLQKVMPTQIRADIPEENTLKIQKGVQAILHLQPQPFRYAMQSKVQQQPQAYANRVKPVDTPHEIVCFNEYSQLLEVDTEYLEKLCVNSQKIAVLLLSYEAAKQAPPQKQNPFDEYRKNDSQNDVWSDFSSNSTPHSIYVQSVKPIPEQSDLVLLTLSIQPPRMQNKIFSRLLALACLLSDILLYGQCISLSLPTKKNRQQSNNSTNTSDQERSEQQLLNLYSIQQYIQKEGQGKNEAIENKDLLPQLYFVPDTAIESKLMAQTHFEQFLALPSRSQTKEKVLRLFGDAEVLWLQDSQSDLLPHLKTTLINRKKTFSHYSAFFSAVKCAVTLLNEENMVSLPKYTLLSQQDMLARASKQTLDNFEAAVQNVASQVKMSLQDVYLNFQQARDTAIDKQFAQASASAMRRLRSIFREHLATQMIARELEALKKLEQDGQRYNSTLIQEIFKRRQLSNLRQDNRRNFIQNILGALDEYQQEATRYKKAECLSQYVQLYNLQVLPNVEFDGEKTKATQKMRVLPEAVVQEKIQNFKIMEQQIEQKISDCEGRELQLRKEVSRLKKQKLLVTRQVRVQQHSGDHQEQSLGNQVINFLCLTNKQKKHTHTPIKRA